MEPSDFKISISVESYEEKTAENYRNCYLPEKRRVSKLTKISIPNINSTNWRLESRLCQNFTSYLLYFPINKTSKNITVGPGRFIVLNDSASPKMVMKAYFNFFRFLLKVLELFEYWRGNPYITTNKNFVSFAHS